MALKNSGSANSAPARGPAEWLVASRYASWESYGKAQEELSKDPAFAKLMAHVASIAELTARNVAVGIHL